MNLTPSQAVVALQGLSGTPAQQLSAMQQLQQAAASLAHTQVSQEANPGSFQAQHTAQVQQLQHISQAMLDASALIGMPQVPAVRDFTTENLVGIGQAGSHMAKSPIAAAAVGAAAAGASAAIPVGSHQHSHAATMNHSDGPAAAPAAAAGPMGTGLLDASTLLQHLQHHWNSAGLGPANPAAAGAVPSLPPAALVAAAAAAAAGQQAAPLQAALLQQLQGQLPLSALLPVLAAMQWQQPPQPSTLSSVSTQQLVPSLLQQQQQSRAVSTTTGASPAATAAAANQVADLTLTVHHSSAGDPAGAIVAANARQTLSCPGLKGDASPGTAAAASQAAAVAGAAQSGHQQQPQQCVLGKRSPPHAEMPVQLPARLRKKIKIVQPISSTWEEEALRKAAAGPTSAEGNGPAQQSGDRRAAKDAAATAQPNGGESATSGAGQDKLEPSAGRGGSTKSAAVAGQEADADVSGGDGSGSGSGSGGSEGDGVRASNSPNPVEGSSSPHPAPQQQQQQHGMAGANGILVPSSVAAAVADAGTAVGMVQVGGKAKKLMHGMFVAANNSTQHPLTYGTGASAAHMPDALTHGDNNGAAAEGSGNGDAASVATIAPEKSNGASAVRAKKRARTSSDQAAAAAAVPGGGKNASTADDVMSVQASSEGEQDDHPAETSQQQRQQQQEGHGLQTKQQAAGWSMHATPCSPFAAVAGMPADFSAPAGCHVTSGGKMRAPAAVGITGASGCQQQLSPGALGNGQGPVGDPAAAAKAAAAVALSQQHGAAGLDTGHAAALQAFLSAGLGGRQGLGIMNQGLGLWAQLQGGIAAAGAPGAAAANGPSAAPPVAPADAAAAVQQELRHLLGPAGATGATAQRMQADGVSIGNSAAAAAAATAFKTNTAANNLATVLQQLQAPIPPLQSLPEGPVKVASVLMQLGMLYAWYASNRAAYLEQVQMLLQLVERNRLVAAALGPLGATAGACSPALRALDKALEIIKGTQALEQYCKSCSTRASRNNAMSGGSANAAQTAGGGGGSMRTGFAAGNGSDKASVAAIGHSSDKPAAQAADTAPAGLSAPEEIEMSGLFNCLAKSGVESGPGGAAAAAAAAAIAAMLKPPGVPAAVTGIAGPATSQPAVQIMGAAAAAAGLPSAAAGQLAGLMQLAAPQQQHVPQEAAEGGVGLALQLAQLLQQQQQQTSAPAAAPGTVSGVPGPLAAAAAPLNRATGPMGLVTGSHAIPGAPAVEAAPAAAAI